MAKPQPVDPKTERTMRGSRISFVESFQDSISMIRSLLKDSSLRIVGNNIAVALPGLYIALLGVNPELLPDG